MRALIQLLVGFFIKNVMDVAMKLAVRASKIDAVKLQLLSTLELEEVNIVDAFPIFFNYSMSRL
tara:strand:+ start:202 stop:393 length:192 start_codon:yes stop_codon:yes gene_type:complete